MRGRVDVLAGSANKVISGVVDTSFGVFRSLLPGGPEPSATQLGEEGRESPAPWNVQRAGFGLLRRESGFSIASLAASLPGRAVARGAGEEAGRQMVEVTSREPSVKSGYTGNEEYSDEDSGGEDGAGQVSAPQDARSIKSFESMMKRERERRGSRRGIADRLAQLPGPSKLGPGQQDAVKVRDPTSLLLLNAGFHAWQESPPQSQRSSMHPPGSHVPTSSGRQTPLPLRLAPPNPRFLECAEDDLKVSEVGELLREYRRLVEAVRAVGGFDD